MGTLFFIITILCFIGLIIGLIKPLLIGRIIKRSIERKTIALVLGGAFIASAIIGSSLDSAKSVDNNQQDNQVVEQQENQNSDNQGITEENQESDNQSEEPAQTEPTQITDNSEPQFQQTTQPSQPISQLFSVVKVVDGDTIKVDINGTTETLRLIGINTPETVDPRKPVECFGIEASNRAKELLSNKKVRLESDSSQGERGIYGRLLRYIWLEDGTFFNKQMILDGYANEYTYNTPYKYQNEFKQAEKEARENKRGLWADDACVDYVDSSTDTPSQTTPEQSTGQYYTSSYHSSTYYYPADCDDWKSLSEKYLESYDSLEALLQVYPLKTLSPQCQE